MAGKIIDGVDVTSNVDRSCDVCIVGSGAGGAVMAAGLAEAGLDVVLLEEGGYHTRQDFNGDEATAFPMLYQEGGTRSTDDLAITILQGRSVGGGTTVNWTTCFRTPDRILSVWQDRFGLENCTPEALRPHFEAVEERLNIHPWPMAPNGTNGALAKGCEALGWKHEVLRRNVKGCANSGYCGMGCPVDGKQAMAVTYIADGVKAGLTVYADTRAMRIEMQGRKAVAVHADVLVRGQPHVRSGAQVTIRPKVLVSSGGAINGPALLLRSGIDLQGLVGRRTFLHPAIAVVGVYPQTINGWYGAPQSISSHQHIDRGSERVGYFLEGGPMHPMLAASSSRLVGVEANAFLARAARTAPLISIAVDGLVPGDEGGTVRVRSDGRIRVSYPVGAHLQESFRSSHEALARVHLAAGSQEVGTMHPVPAVMRSEADLSKLDGLAYGAHEHAIFTAHQMGGCPMGADPTQAVVDSQLRLRDTDNVFVVDGSVLPTSLGVNPSETIYALSHRARDWVAAAV